MDVSSKFPVDEKFELKSNMRRAARSTTRNIAEGFGRHSVKENIQFCRISRGSLYELLDDLITARDESYITKEEFEVGKKLVFKAIMIINGYIRYLSSISRKTISSHPGEDDILEF